MEMIGVAAVALLGLKIAYNVTHFFYTAFVGAALGHNIDLRQHGPWAVVTGATDGIGKAYAQKLASLGLNIVLISRTLEKLQQVAEEIKKSSPSIEIKIIAVNFTDGNSIYSRLRTELADLDIGILINNVGMAVGFAEPFADIADDQQLHDVVNCNIMSMARMTHIVLPLMMERQKGIIINIGSISGAFSTPLATIYGATKAFVDKFSRDLSAEVKAKGIVVQTVHPGYVVTNMSRLRRATMTKPNPTVFVEASFRTLGLESRTSAFWYHKIELYWGEMLRFFAPSLMEKLVISELTRYREKIINRKRK